MSKKNKFAIAGALGALMLLGVQTEAMAWGCVAVANDGTYGYSYNYGSRKAARQRARQECNARTYDECYITSCDPNG
jgi:hypothetical protein